MKRSCKPLVRFGCLTTGVVAPDLGAPIQIDSPGWYTWLADGNSFIYEGLQGHLTARCELRRGASYWYGYRRRDGKLSKTYLGKSADLTQETLEQASALLAGRAPYQALPGNDALASRTHSPDKTSSAAVSGAEFAELPPLPLTKVKPPVMPSILVPRPRLTHLIMTPATILCAPSGFGKSTMLNEWRRSCGMPVGWVALDAADNDPLRFWSAVVAALPSIAPEFSQGLLKQLHESTPAAFSRIVVSLTDEIIRVTEAMDTVAGIGLVLDSYHHIQNPQIHTALQTWLDHIPPKFYLVLASQINPPLALGYLRAKGMVTELGVDDLRFTLEEASEFLRRHAAGKHLSDWDMQILVRSTAGWVTGLVLAAHALTQLSDQVRFGEPFNGTHPLLQEYLTQNVLRCQPPEMQTFLLTTSILRSLTGPLCDAVTGQNGGTEQLARLAEQQLFIDRLDTAGWYRYHDLFAEMLQAQLQAQFPARIYKLHRAAAAWYRAHAVPVEAIHHYLASKSWNDAAALIEVVALSELEKLGEDSRLLRWLQQLPETVVQQHPILLIVYIRLAKLVLPAREVDDFLSRAELRITSLLSSEKTNTLLKTLSEIKRFRHSWVTDNPVRLGRHPGREPDTVSRLLDGILRYHRQTQFDLVKAEEKANEVYTAASARGHLYSMLMAGGACASLAYSQGNLKRSEQVAQKVLQQSRELREGLPEPASIALIALSGVYFERNQLAQAYQVLNRAIEVDPQPIRPDEFISAAIQRAKIQSTQGETDTAFDTIQAIRESNAHHPSSLWRDQDLIAYQALFRLSQGDVAAADRHLSGGWEVDQHPFSAFIRASILVEQNRNLAAEEILRHLVERYPHGFYWVPILRARVKLATALFSQKKVNQACQVMAEAARLAAPEYFVRPFLVPAPEFPVLLSLVLHTENLNPGTRTFLKGTLAGLGYADELEDKSDHDEPKPLAMAASISPREQEILYSLSVGLSNQEIAAQYSISTSTVKTHLENIYRKLGVNNRMQAIAKAQGLRLV